MGGGPAYSGITSLTHILKIRNSCAYLLPILVLSLLLNLWGLNWGLPGDWHPDELTDKAVRMIHDKSLNPHHFAYGSLHYYQIILFVAPAHTLNQALHLFDAGTEHHLIWLLSRVLSALLGTGTVLLVFLLTRALFDQKSALFGSLLLTLSMGHVNISHFATTDIPSAFWFTFSCLMSAYVFIHDRQRWYLLSGLFAGFAAAVKYISGIAIISLIIAHFLGSRRGHKNLAIGIIMALIGFLVANPVAIFSICEFSEGLLKELFFNSIRSAEEPYAFLPLIFRLREAMGLPLLLLCVCGALYSGRLLFLKEFRAKVLLVWSMILPYYLVIGSMHFSPLRYVVLIAPFLLILTGKMVSDLISMDIEVIRVISIILIMIVIGYSLIFTIAADLKFTNDSRKSALEWILQNVPEGSKIEVTRYTPNIPTDKYMVVKRPHNSKVDELASLLKSNSTFLFLHTMIYRFGTVAQKVKLCKEEKPYYRAWYEQAMTRYSTESANFDLSAKGLEARGSDYLIVSSQYFRSFLRDSLSEEGQFFDSLLSEKTNYKQVAKFEYRFSSWVDPKVELVNPTIFVYRRANAASK